MANVDGDTGAGGKRSDFEAAESFLLPKDPVAARLREGQKRPNATISDATADDAQISAFGSKPGNGPKYMSIYCYILTMHSQLALTVSACYRRLGDSSS